MKKRFLRAFALFALMAFLHLSSFAQTITGYSPTDNSGSRSIHTDIILTFSTSVNIPFTATGSINVANYDQGTSIQMFDKGSSGLTEGPNANQITISLSDSLPYNTMITVAIYGNLINSSTGYFSGLTYGFYNFMTELDTEAPYIEWLGPNNNQTNFPPHGNLLAGFNQEVMPGTGTIYIKDFNTDNILFSYAPAEVVGGSGFGINPALTLAANTHFYVEIPNGAILDLAGNPFPGLTKTDWSFTTGDDTNTPSLAIKNPEYGMTGVSVGTNIELSFDENVQAGGGAFQIYTASGSLLETIISSGSQATFSGNMVTLTPTNILPENTQIYLKIDGSAVKDMYNHFYGGISSTNGYVFETGAGASSPEITLLNPADDAVSVAPSANLSLTFNKNIQKGTGSVTLYKYGTNEIAETFNVATSSAVSVSINTLTLNPTITLSGKYYVTVQDGAIESFDGASYLGFSDKNIWNFTTEATMGDIVSPVISSISPASNSTGIPIDQAFTITFNENVMAGNSGGFSMYDATNDLQLGSTWSLPGMMSVSGNQVTVTYPTGFIAADQAVYFVLSEMGITDMGGNIWGGFVANEYILTFSNTDVTAPVISSLSPANGETLVALSADLVLTASENISLSSLGTIYINHNGTTIKSIFMGDPSVTISGNSMTITNGLADLNNNATYGIYVYDNLFIDAAGNGMVGTGGNAWEFTTAAIVDNTAPQITSLFPANGTSGVSLSANLILTADENLVPPTSGSILIKEAGSTVNTIPFTDASVSFSGNTMTVSNALSGLNNSTEYSVVILDNILKDAAGNGMTGTSSGNWVFTTEAFVDVTGPQIVNFSPANNATEIPLDQPFVITFDEAVQEINSGIFRMFDANTGVQLSITLAMPGMITVSGNQVTVDYPNGQIAPGQSVYFTLSSIGIADLTGNTWAGLDANDYTITFESPDVTAPAILSLTPANGALDVAFNSNLTLFTDEAMIAPTSGNILIKQGSSIVKTIPFTDATVLFEGNTMTIGNALLGLNFSTEYFVEIANGAITDAAGNGMTAINAANWSFTTEAFVDITAPQVVSISPTDGATGLTLDQAFVITFDEDIQKANSGFFAMYESQSGIQLGTNWFLPNLVSVSGNQATITFPAGFTSYEQSVYFVLNGCIQDLTGNTWAGIAANEYTVTYEAEVIGDITAPAITSINPTNGTINFPIDQPFVITFNENVQEINSGSFAMFDASTDVQLGVDWFLPAIVSISGNQATITYPTGYVSPDQSVYFVLNGTIQDMAGNFWSGFSANEYTITYGGGDHTAPVISSLSPANGATDISLSAVLILTADEALVAPTSGNILIKQGGTTVNTIPFTDASVSFSGNTMTVVNALSGLSNTTQYSVEIADNIITDLAGNGLLGTNAASWSFTTEAFVDVTPPQIVSISPANGSTDVTLDQQLVITFDEDIVEFNDGTFQMFESGTNTQIGLNWFAPNFFSVSGNQATINYPAGYIEQSQSVYFVISGVVVKDIAGNAWAGFAADDYTLTYQFLDVVSPVITNYSPTFAETGVSLNSDLVLTFDEDAYASGIGAVSIRENGVARASVNMTDPSISFVGNQMTVATPLLGLNYETEYTVHIVAAAVIDASDNYFVGTNETTWKFTTEVAPDLTAPTVVSVSPLNGAIDVSMNQPIVITFDEAIQELNGGTLSIFESGTNLQLGFDLFMPDFVAISGNQATITYPADYITPGQTVYFVLSDGGIADLAGNSWSGYGINQYTITYPDTQGPQIVSFSPANGSVGVAQDQPFVITFDEDIQGINDGSIRIFESGTNTQMGVSWYLPNQVTVSGNQATFTYPAGYTLPGQTVFFAITAAGIQDMAGNNWSGLAFDEYTITFAELNIPAPEVASLSPANGEFAVALSADLVMITNEEMVIPSSGNILIKDGAITVNTIPYNDASVTFAANQLTITNALAGLNYGTQYAVEIAENTIEGLTGNTMAGTNATNWSFVTETFVEAVFPDVISVSPEDGAVGVVFGSDLIMTIASDIIVPTSGSILIKDAGVVVVTIPLTDVSVDYTNNVMTVSNALLGLEYGTLYTVEIVDVTRGNLRGVNNLFWSFTTEECTTVNDITTSINANTVTANQTGASYQWLDCDNGNSIIDGATSQSFTATVSGTYTCEIVNGCATDLTDCVTLTVISVESISTENNFMLFPNPAINQVTIQGLGSEIQTIQVYNFSGKLVKVVNSNSSIIDISALPAGIYILQIRTTNNVENKRFIKE